ncbi:hypothetical protein TPENAI_30011 [Tenacibaculum litopenaei]|uniref:hypothetical protein n=1 Tax=Tenacibaculum litopenaei TaxID=396016 RepID=UPI0038943E4A
MKKITVVGVVILVVVSIFCIKKEESKKENVITGDWVVYHADSLREGKSEELFEYTELFFSTNTLYRYSNLGGLLSPTKYEITQDSLFFYTKESSSNKSFVGKLTIAHKDTLSITDGNYTIILYKLRSEHKLMSDYIGLEDHFFTKFDTSNKEFLTGFLDRMKTCFKKVK